MGIGASNQYELKDFLMNYYTENPMLEYVLLIFPLITLLLF